MRRLALVAAAAGLAGCFASFNVDTGRKYPCTLDAGEDLLTGDRDDSTPRQCAQHWRCGLELVCHALDAGAPYKCDGDDSWCEAGWTCSETGFCVPPIDDGLFLDAGEGPVTAALVSPRFLRQMPDRISIAPDEATGPVFGSGAAYTIGSELSLVGRARIGPPGDGLIGNYIPFFFRAQLPSADVRDIASSVTAVPETLVLTATGTGYVHADFDAGFDLSAAVYQHAWPGVTGDALRLIPEQRPFAIVLGQGTLAVLTYPMPLFPRDAGGDFSRFVVDGGPVLRAIFLPDGGPGFVPGGDLVDLTWAQTDAGVMVSTIDRQLYVAELNRGPEFYAYALSPGGGLPERVPVTDGLPRWIPAPLLPTFQAGNFEPFAYDGGYLIYEGGPPFQAGRVSAYGDRIAVQVDGGTGPMLMLTQLHTDPPPGFPIGFPFLTLELAPCPACPVGADLVDFRPGTSGRPVIEVHCAYPDGGHENARLLSSVGAVCGSEPLLGPSGALNDRVLPSRSLAGQGGWAGGHGQLWLGNSLATATPFFLDQPPDVLLGTADGIAVFSGSTFFRELYLQQGTVPAGLVAFAGLPDDGFMPVAVVIGREDWALSNTGFIGRKAVGGGFGSSAGSVVARPGTSFTPEDFKPPYLASVALTANGGAVAVAASNDALFSADVSAIYTQATSPPGTMEFRTVLAPRIAIRSLAALDVEARPDGGVTPYARGYAIARTQLFEWSAASPDFWRSQSVAVPAGALAEVWADHDRARLGYVDGHVLALPSQRLLAPALSEPVSDFLEFHGQTWAVTPGGLWRLAAPKSGGFSGTWERGPDLAAVVGGPVDLAGARLAVALDALYLFTATGTAVQLQ